MDFQTIKSADNLKVKNLKKLKLRKYREKNHEFFLENFKIIKDAFCIPHYPKEIFLTQKYFEKNKKELLALLQTKPEIKVYFISERLNKSFSQVDTPSGVAAVYDKPDKPIIYNDKIIYLNGISDPGNLGTIMRTAVFFGFKDIVLDEFCADAYNAKTINAAKDAIFKCSLGFDKQREILNKIGKTMDICLTDVKAGGDASKIRKKKKYCLVFGSEAGGVDEKIFKMAKYHLHISSKGDMESLNVAVAAGIIFFELSG